jgi:hypothetical protein
VPTGAGVDAVATSAAAATGPSFVTANVSHKVSPPTALAIIAILALAIVSSVCAHRFLGGALLLRLPRRRG